jgi:hypothetical protein
MLPPRLLRVTRPRACTIALLLGTLVSAPSLQAQLVGSEPSRSPFRDLEKTQQLTFSLGWFDATTDAAGVGPKPAPVFSLRHDLNIGGPAWLTTRYSAVRTERRVIDPGLPLVDREQGLQSVTHHVADIGLTIALTGRKTWHQLVPTLGGGLGVTSDFGSRRCWRLPLRHQVRLHLRARRARGAAARLFGAVRRDQSRVPVPVPQHVLLGGE